MPVWRAAARGTPKVTPNMSTSIGKVSNLDLRYDEGVSTLTFYGEVRSASRPVGYSVMLTFKGVKPTDGLNDDEIQQGYKPKPSLAKNEVLMRCSCPNYRFRFDKSNRSHSMGTGARFGVYHRKTDRKPNNPLNLPGFCSHCLAFVEYLQQQGFIY